MHYIKLILKTIWYLPRHILCAFISVYQKTLSFDHGPLKKYFPYGYCKYKPSCSQYCSESIKDKGAILGTIKCTWRVLRCNPCSRGGYDPVHKNH